jgi:hypothetical protein
MKDESEAEGKVGHETCLKDVKNPQSCLVKGEESVLASGCREDVISQGYVKLWPTFSTSIFYSAHAPPFCNYTEKAPEMLEKVSIKRVDMYVYI